MEKNALMKILYIASHITDSGGVSRVVALKANYFAKTLQHQVFIFSTNDQKNIPFFHFSDKIQFYFSKHKHIGLHNILSFKNEIKNYCLEIKPDVIFMVDNGIKSLLITNDLYKNAKTFYELHASKEYLRNHSYKGLKKYLNRFLIQSQLGKYNKIVCLSNEQFLDFIPSSKQIVIPNPLPFSCEKSSSLNNKKAIAVGRIIPLKGYDRMLKIWKKVIEKHPDYTLEIYGKESADFSITPLIKKLKLELHVRIFPETNDIEQRYLQADFLLHTSHSESFGMVFIEAMSCGLPVVCFETESNAIVKNHFNGFLSTNETDFEQNVITLIENFQHLKSMAENAKKSVTPFQQKNIMKLWNQLLNNY